MSSILSSKMAARIDAAAHSSSRQQCVLLFLFVCLFFLCPSCRAFITYSRQDLFRIGLQSEQFVIEDFTNTHNIPPDIAQPPGSPWTVIPAGRRRRRRKERKQKRGCRAGALARLRRRPHKLPLPSIFLSNARSLANKMDELKLQLAANRLVRDCCILLITETWLHSWNLSLLDAGPCTFRVSLPLSW